MKKSLSLLLLLFSVTITTSATPSAPSSDIQIALQIANYCFGDAVKNIALAYIATLAITTIHELGHAVTAKVLFNSPIDITLGSSQVTSKVYLQCGGIKLAGFNPTAGYTRIKGTTNSLRNIAVLSAGPLSGLAASTATYALIKNKPQLYLLKLATAFNIITESLLNGVIGAIYYPESDGGQILSEYKKYVAAQ